MPQLVKGGKHVFAWSRIGLHGKVRVPPEALAEYRLQDDPSAILTSASKTSGGFALVREDVFRQAPLGTFLNAHPELAGSLEQGTILRGKQRLYSRVALRSGEFTLSPEQAVGFGVHPGDLLLVVRGSGLGPSFLAKGPILEEARAHPELEVFEPLAG